MTRWTITYRGVPVAVIEAPSPDHLGALAVSPLPAFDALRPALPTVWRDAEAVDVSAGAHTPHAAVAPDALELRDEQGTAVPTSRLELVVTGPRSAVAFISFDAAAALIGARLGVRPRGTTAMAPEA